MNTAPSKSGGAGELTLGIKLFVVLHDVLRFCVAFNQQLVRWEDFGVHLGPFGGIRAIPCALQFGSDGCGIHRYDARLRHAGQSDLLRHFAVGTRSVDDGKPLITVSDRSNSREGHADAGDRPGNN